MSTAEDRWTPAQRRGVTNTSTGSSGGSSRSSEERGAWSQDLETAVYGEQEWIIPGMGESGDDCGRWWPENFCDEHAHIDLQRHECGRRSCGHTGCHSRWMREKAVAITVRMGAARYAAAEGEKRAIHGIVSPPEESVTTIEDFYDMIGDAYDLAKEKGVRGGVAVPHGYRIKDEIKDIAEAKREKGEFVGGDWKFARECDRHWRDCVYWSPHVHIIGWVGSNDVQEGDSEGDDGWVWHNRRSLEEFHLTREDGYDDMIGLAHYLMSHVTLQKGEGRQAYRWFGELSAASFSPQQELSEGTLTAIQRRAERVAGCPPGEEEGDGAAGDEEAEECPVEECEGELVSIWDAEAFMEQNGDELTEGEYDRLMTANLWRRGEIEPPPGLKRPKTEQDAREAFKLLTDGGDACGGGLGDHA